MIGLVQLTPLPPHCLLLH